MLLRAKDTVTSIHSSAPLDELTKRNPEALLEEMSDEQIASYMTHWQKEFYTHLLPLLASLAELTDQEELQQAILQAEHTNDLTPAHRLCVNRVNGGSLHQHGLREASRIILAMTIETICLSRYGADYNDPQVIAQGGVDWDNYYARRWNVLREACYLAQALVSAKGYSAYEETYQVWLYAMQLKTALDNTRDPEMNRLRDWADIIAKSSTLMHRHASADAQTFQVSRISA